MRNDILQLIKKYEDYIERVNDSIKVFPQHEIPLMSRKTVYMDIILDLKNLVERWDSNENNNINAGE